MSQTHFLNSDYQLRHAKLLLAGAAKAYPEARIYKREDQALIHIQMMLGELALLLECLKEVDCAINNLRDLIGRQSEVIDVKPGEVLSDALDRS